MWVHLGEFDPHGYKVWAANRKTEFFTFQEFLFAKFLDMQRKTIIFTVSLPIMRATDTKYWTMGRVPKAPKKAKAFKWNVYAKEFVPASEQRRATANNATAAPAAEPALNPFAEEFIPEHLHVVHTPNSPVHTSYPPVYTPFPYPVCYGQWPCIYLYIVPIAYHQYY
ncbi:hypothetical protein DFS34DRAFT_591029 [Phlyctochytrium arcticum]|nr:hypothetical protein DFS34DRAFT_591029 [Phlyctochytrium arcticum]